MGADLTQQSTQALLDALRHQCTAPQVTTMGPCANDCGRAARGGAVCSVCIATEIEQRMQGEQARDYAHAHNYAYHQRAAMRAWWALQEGCDGG